MMGFDGEGFGVLGLGVGVLGFGFVRSGVLEGLSGLRPLWRPSAETLAVRL